MIASLASHTDLTRLEGERRIHLCRTSRREVAAAGRDDGQRYERGAERHRVGRPHVVQEAANRPSRHRRQGQSEREPQDSQSSGLRKDATTHAIRRRA